MGILMLPTLLVVFMFFALGLDAGLWYFDHRWAQTQAEAAAAAAIVYLPAADVSDAIAASDLWLQRNGTDPAVDSTCPRSGAGNGRVILDEAPFDGRSESVLVCVRRLRPSLFGALSGVTSVYVSAQAKARVSEEPSPYSVMAMNDDICSGSLYVHDRAILNITGGGGTYTRCPSSSGLQEAGDSEIRTGVNDIVSGTWGGAPNPLPTLQRILDDPYEDLVQPDPNGLSCALQTINIGVINTLRPGRYCSPVTINGAVTIVRLQPGVYMFEQGLQVNAGTLTGDANGNSVLDPSEEVVLYSTCPQSGGVRCDGRTAGDMVFLGHAIIELRAPGNWNRMVLWTDRTSGITPRPLISIDFGDSSAQERIEGRIYNVNGVVDFAGSDDANLTLAMSIVAGNVDLHGEATFNMAWDPFNVPPERVWALVE